MDGRAKLLGPCFIVILLAGCTSTNSAKKLDGLHPAQSVSAETSGPESKVVTASASAAPAQPTSSSKKTKDAPKRSASPEMVCSLGNMCEEAAKKKKKDEPEHFIKLMDEARQIYQSALKTDPEFVKARDGLVRVYTQLGEHHRAQELIRKSLEKNSRDGRLWVELGMTYNRQKNYDEAIKAFRKALEIDPEKREYMQALGFTLVWAGRTHEGLDHLVVAMGRAGAHYNVAGVLRQQNRMDEAQQHLKVCLEIDPNFERARDMIVQMRPDGSDPGGPAPGATLPGVLPASSSPAASTGPAPVLPPVATPARSGPEALPALDFIPLKRD